MKLIIVSILLLLFSCSKEKKDVCECSQKHYGIEPVEQPNGTIQTQTVFKYKTSPIEEQCSQDGKTVYYGVSNTQWYTVECN